MTKYLLTILNSYIVFGSLGQNYPVQTILYSNNQYPQLWTNYESGYSNPFELEVILQDQTSEPIEITFSYILSGPGLEIYSGDLNHQTELISPLESLWYNSFDLSNLFKINDLIVTGTQRASFQQTKMLPEGNYTINMWVSEKFTGRQISNNAITNFQIIKQSPPDILTPNNDAFIDPMENVPLQISWIPRHNFFLSNPSYQLQLYELTQGGLSTMLSNLSNYPFATVETEETMLTLDPLEFNLMPGRNYAFRVKLVDGPDNEYMYKNKGYSEWVEFTYGRACALLEFPEIKEVNFNSAYITWSDPYFDEYIIRFAEENDDIWYEESVTSPFVELKDLNSSTRYSFQVKKICGAFSSDYSEKWTFETIEKPPDQYQCSLSPNFQTHSSDLISTFSPGEYFYSLDFKVVVMELFNSESPFSGVGFIEFPYFKMAKIGLEFNDIEINQDLNMVSGAIYLRSGELILPEKINSYLDSLDILLDKADHLLTVAQLVTDSIQSINDENTNDTIAQDSLSVEDNGLSTSSQSDSVYLAIDSITTIYSLSDSSSATNATISTNVSQTQNTNSDPQTGEGTTSTQNYSSSEFTQNNNGYQFSIGAAYFQLDEEPKIYQITNNGDAEYRLKNVACKIPIKFLGLTRQIELNIPGFSLVKDTIMHSILDLNIKVNTFDNPVIITTPFLNISLTQLELGITSDGLLTGKMVAEAKWSIEGKEISELIQTIDQPAGQLEINIQPGLELMGIVDFSGLQLPEIKLEKFGETLFSGTNLQFDEQGNLTIHINNNTGFSSEDKVVSVHNLELIALLNVTQGFVFQSGSIDASLSLSEYFDEPIYWSATISHGEFEANFSSDDISFLDIKVQNLTGSLSLNQDLTLNTVSFGFELMSPTLNGSLNVKDLTIENGELVTLTTSGKVDYNGFSISILESTYQKSSGTINLKGVGTYVKEGNELTVYFKNMSLLPGGELIIGDYTIDLTLERQFGPVKVLFESSPVTSGTENGFEIYNQVKATVSIPAIAKEKQSEIILTEAMVSFKSNANNDWKDVHIQLSDIDLPFLKINEIESRLQYADIRIKSREEIEFTGKINCTTKLPENLNIPLGPTNDISLSILKDSEIIYEVGVSGKGEHLNFDFTVSEIKNGSVGLVKSNTLLGQVEDVNFKDGKLSGRVINSQEISLDNTQFKSQIKHLNFTFSVYPFETNKDFTLLDGEVNLTIDQIGPLEGTIEFLIRIDNGNILAENKSENIKFNRLTLSDVHMVTQIDHLLNVQSVEGSFFLGIGDTSGFLVSNFSYSDGQVQEFYSEGGTIEYKGFKFSLHGLSYNEHKINADATVNLTLSDGKSARLGVESFKINENGEYTIGKISGDLQFDPALVSFEATFSESRFSGTFSGEFGSYFDMSGTLDIGSENSYTFGYLSLSSQTNIPIGPAFKISRLSGNLGFNYKLSYHSGYKSFIGKPMEGNYVAGLGLGISDIAGAIELYGNPIIQFGDGDTQLNMIGEVKLPADNPNFLGQLTANYNLSQDILNGSIVTTVKIPAKTGKIVNAVNNSLKFHYSEEGYWMKSNTLKAKVFNVIDFEGKFNYIKNGLYSEEGYLYGVASLNFQKSFEAEFFLGSIQGDIGIAFEALAELEWTEQVVNGRIDATISGSTNVNFTNSFLGTIEIASSFEGLGSVEYRSGTTQLFASLDFELEAMGESVTINKEINHQFQ